MKKYCPKCQHDKPIHDFYKSRKDGYQSRCKECQKTHHVKYDAKYSKAYYRNTKGVQKVRKKRSNYKEAWSVYFKSKYGDVPRCEICDLILRWPNENNDNQVVHFDHRHNGDEPWTSNPIGFYSNRPCTRENIDVWELCDFGVLCIKCNGALPTQNRKRWVSNVNRYVFHKDINND